jgi:hypothetical protein
VSLACAWWLILARSCAQAVRVYHVWRAHHCPLSEFKHARRCSELAPRSNRRNVLQYQHIPHQSGDALTHRIRTLPGYHFVAPVERTRSLRSYSGGNPTFSACANMRGRALMGVRHNCPAFRIQRIWQVARAIEHAYTAPNRGQLSKLAPYMQANP